MELKIEFYREKHIWISDLYSIVRKTILIKISINDCIYYTNKEKYFLDISLYTSVNLVRLLYSYYLKLQTLELV